MHSTKVISLRVLKNHIVYTMEGTPPQICDDIQVLNIGWPLWRQQRRYRPNFIKVKTLLVSLSHYESCSLITCTDFTIRFLKFGHSLLDILYFYAAANRPAMRWLWKRPFLGNSSVNTFPLQWICVQQKSYCWKWSVSMWSVLRCYISMGQSKLLCNSVLKAVKRRFYIWYLECVIH
jgi:hypothetical protein